MDFSVIIATRNRPVLVRTAIQSVLDQTHPSVEIILVKDGSDSEHAAAYAAIKEELASRGSFIELRHTKRGHGQSYAYNRAAEVAQGAYLCFLDDDDCWTDPQHLGRAWAALAAPGRQAEVYFSCQKAYLDGVLIDRQIWLEGLAQKLKDRRAPMVGEVYPVSVKLLMECENFAHVNTSIVSRALYARIGGFDENIRYENDRDFYLRQIDHAQGMLYSPHFVARHNAPDQTKTLNLSTSVSTLEKGVERAFVWNKARLFSNSPSIRKVANRSKGYTLRHIAVQLLEDGRTSAAFNFGTEALGTFFSFKWLAYCCYLGMRAAFGPRHR